MQSRAILPPHTRGDIVFLRNAAKEILKELSHQTGVQRVRKFQTPSNIGISRRCNQWRRWLTIVSRKVTDFLSWCSAVTRMPTINNNAELLHLSFLSSCIIQHVCHAKRWGWWRRREERVRRRREYLPGTRQAEGWRKKSELKRQRCIFNREIDEWEKD